MEQRNAPSDSLGILAAFPLAEWIGGAGHFAAPDWPDPFESISNTENAPRYISLPAQEWSHSDAREIVLDLASSQDLEQLADREFELPPPTNILDRVFAGLEFDPLAPRRTALGGLSASVMTGDAAHGGYLPGIVNGANTPASTTAGPPAAPLPDESDAGGGGGDQVVEKAVKEAQVNWEAVAIAYATNQGSLKLVDGEVDVTAALTDLGKALVDRAESVGMGEAKKQIIGENPTVDLPVGGESELESGSGESMAMSSGSGSGCGQNSGSNQAPFAYDDQFTVSASLPTSVPVTGVLANDVTQIGETMTAVLSTQAVYGSVLLQGNGSFNYTPPAQARANDTFFYQVYDGQLYSCPALVSLGMPLIDLDTDSDNSGLVDRSTEEENLEMTAPGKVIAYNKDDDNGNGIPDYQDATTTLPSGVYGNDNDLSKAVYAPSLPTVADGYRFKFTPTANIQLWRNGQKGAFPLEWAFSPTDLYTAGDVFVEGLAVGPAEVKYQMFRGDGLLVHEDTVKFTVMEVNLAIGDGQQANTSSPSFVPEALEESRGAFTVANLNDTDGDGRTDVMDSKVRFYGHLTTASAAVDATVLTLASVNGFEFGDSVVVFASAAPNSPNETHTIIAINPQQKKITLNSGLQYALPVGGSVQHHGRNEVDLMPLRIYKPTTLVPGVNTMTLTFPPGVIALWSGPTKVDAIPLDGPGTKVFDVTSMGSHVTYWAESLTPSEDVQDVVMNLIYAGIADTVKATGIWVDFVAAEHSTRSAASVMADLLFEDLDTQVASTLTTYGGTGHAPIALNEFGEDHGASNGILMKVHALPKGIGGESAVRFDVTRSLHRASTLSGNGPASNEVRYFPLQWEYANDDDTDDIDESFQPTPLVEHPDGSWSGQNMYSFDAPGKSSIYANGRTLSVFRANFVEWVRVKFDVTNQNQIEGEGIKGSRSSPRFDWHATQRLVPTDDEIVWRRSTGANPSGSNDPELAGTNDVANGHVNVGDPPLP